MKQSMQNTNDSFAKSSKEVGYLLQEVLEKASKMGVTAAAVSANFNRGFSVEVRMGEVDTVEFNEDKGISVSVYSGQRVGQASSTDTSSESIERIIQSALDIAKVSAVDPCFGLADKQLMSRNQADLDLYHPWDMTPEKAIKTAIECEHEALSYDKRIINSDGVGVSTTQSCFGYANTHGAFGVQLGTHHSLSCAVMAQENNKNQRDYDYSTGRIGANLASISQIAQQASQRTIERLNAQKIKTQKAPVIFSNRLSSGFINHFIQAISGGNLYRKSSFLLDSLGKQLFPKWMNIYEQPFLKQELGSACFDGDGVSTRENKIVQEGCLRQYVLGTYSARRLGMETTANASGVHNLTIDSNEPGGLNELLKTMHTGLLVTELMGQGVNGLTGDYSRGASGFWVENGQIAFPVEEITIAGQLRSLFNNIIAIGSDVNPNYATKCGSLLIEKMTIAGA